MALHVAIDPELCIGSGDCGRVAPAAFALDESMGISVVIAGVATSDLELLVRAARACPTQAIRVVKDDGTVLHDSAIDGGRR